MCGRGGRLVRCQLGAKLSSLEIDYMQNRYYAEIDII